MAFTPRMPATHNDVKHALVADPSLDSTFIPSPFGSNNDESCVLMILTGGTICMTPSGESASLRPSSLSEFVLNLPEIQSPEIPRFDILEWNYLVDSSDVSLPEWTKLTKQIHRFYKLYDGFVVLIGTDTMCFAAGALSFMLENLRKPVVFTGSMLPMYSLKTDARRNLASALSVAAYSPIMEVCIAFGGRVTRGNRCRKLDSSSIDAFNSPNLNPLGRIGTDIFIDDNLLLQPRSKNFSIFTDLCLNVVLVNICPGFPSRLLQSIFETDTRPLGVVLGLYGQGTAPGDPEFIRTIQTGISSGVEVAAITQCAAGGCSLLTYENGVNLYKAGVMEGHDLTPEAAYTKLAYLLGKGYRGKALRHFFEADLRGELTEDVGAANKFATYVAPSAAPRNENLGRPISPQHSRVPVVPEELQVVRPRRSNTNDWQPIESPAKSTATDYTREPAESRVDSISEL